MRLRGSVIIFALVVGLAGVADAAGGARSKVTIDDPRSVGMKFVFTGQVESQKGSCEPGRTVKVIGRDESTGERRTLGTDRTNQGGAYRVTERIPFNEDFAYAKVKRLKDGSGTKCKPDRSREISLSG